MGQWDDRSKDDQALDRALAAVEAMGKTDAVVVPATPSPSMLVAGARDGGVSEETAARIYRAMILAGCH